MEMAVKDLMGVVVSEAGVEAGFEVMLAKVKMGLASLELKVVDLMIAEAVAG